MGVGVSNILTCGAIESSEEIVCGGVTVGYTTRHGVRQGPVRSNNSIKELFRIVVLADVRCRR